MGQGTGAGQGQQQMMPEHRCEPYGARMATRDQPISYMSPYPGCHVLRKDWKGCLSTGAPEWIPGVPLCQHPKP